MAMRILVRLLSALALCAAVAACGSEVAPVSEHTTSPGGVVPAPAVDVPAGTARTATAVFAGGCFWGVQAVYQHVDGVLGAVSGYAGGTKDTADYKTVSAGKTGHAESVEVTFDPSVVSYGKLLQIFFTVVADPTTLNAQGPDRGTQYRTEIFTTSAEQADVANAYIAQLGSAHAFSEPIVTKVSTLDGFYRAEDYHQNFLAMNPDNPYIVANDMPKLDALQKLFPAEYRPQPS
ncbi:peptide-methionine (S)-S-oxide reductase MsrA [Antrihabitans stalactiti]|uniref:Peptide methionine sulfoxide reductase MsrA n=1 Tax=Antrihabitans stalactiti TaxID=2584121 RepID=A0A848KN79_9NOCA|nr:peptide-methionine (S)-S-oxide reductase MsrA [Antrihabitans stalactiti]NMN97167.1 peptide-methionine (S)-S-oxide reductase MsrA [Antrihabitans stalactiti]